MNTLKYISLSIFVLSHFWSNAQFVNGDFQLNPTYGCTAGEGWTTIEGVNSAELTDVFYPGNFWIDLTPCGGWGNGTWIQQSIPTVVGQCYSVTMDLGSLCGWDVSDAGVYVFADGVQVGERLYNNQFNCLGGPMYWITVTSATFVATQASTTIRIVGEGHCSQLSVATGEYACSPEGALGNPGVIGLDNIVLNTASVGSVFVDFSDENLCDTSSVVIGESMPGLHFLWSTGDTTASIEVETPGLYTVQYFNTCASGLDSVNVSAVSPLAPFSLGNDIVICSAFPVPIGTVDGTSVNWFDGPNAPSILVFAPGYYEASLTNTCGTVYDGVWVTQSTDPDTAILEAIDFPDQLLCDGESATIGSDIANVHFLWSTGDTLAQITVNEAGNYEVTFTSLCGSATDQIEISTINSPPLFSLGPDITMCHGQTVNWTTSDASTQWSTGSTGSLLEVSESGMYSATIANDCGVSSDTVMVEVIPQVLYPFDSTAVMCETPVWLEATVYSIADSVAWDNGEMSLSTLANVPGLYYITAFNACESATGVFNVIVECDEFSFYAPNVFTPNNDGTNEVWITSLTGSYDTFDLSIWNRWGNKIWGSQNPLTGWSGQVLGGDYFVPDGTYYYMVEIKRGGETHSYQGHITLLR